MEMLVSEYRLIELYEIVLKYTMVSVILLFSYHGIWSIAHYFDHRERGGIYYGIMCFLTAAYGIPFLIALETQQDRLSDILFALCFVVGFSGYIAYLKTLEHFLKLKSRFLNLGIVLCCAPILAFSIEAFVLWQGHPPLFFKVRVNDPPILSIVLGHQLESSVYGLIAGGIGGMGIGVSALFILNHLRRTNSPEVLLKVGIIISLLASLNDTLIGINLLLSGFPLYYLGNAFEVVRFHAHYSKRKLALENAQRRKAEDYLVRAKESAEQASQSKSVFLASMSHELKTPLTGVRGYLELAHELLLGGASKHEVADSIRLANINSLHLEEIVSNLLDFSQYHGKSSDLKKEEFKIIDVLDRVIGFFKPIAQHRGNNIRLSIDPSSTVVSNKHCLSRVIFNIVSNAVKFTENGFIEISAGSTEDGFVFIVKDSGIGIPGHLMKDLQKPFEKFNPNGIDSSSGAGLGLALSKELLLLCGGRLEVKSLEAVGTEVSILIPVDQVERMGSMPLSA